jgi:hypothetical protein
MENFKNKVSIKNFYKSDMTLMSLPNDEPSFKLIQQNNKLHTMFLLQDRILLKKKQLLYVTEILITEPKTKDLYDLINSKITIVEFFSKSKNFKIGKINDLTFPIQELNNLSIIQEKLPKKETYLQLDKEYETQIINHIKNTERK